MSHVLCPRCRGTGLDPKPLLIKRCFACSGVGAVQVAAPSVASCDQPLLTILRRRSFFSSLLPRPHSLPPRIAAPAGPTLEKRGSGDLASRGSATELGEFAAGPVGGVERGLEDLVLKKEDDGTGGPPSPKGLDRQASFASCMSDIEDDGGVSIVTRRRASFCKPGGGGGSAPTNLPPTPSGGRRRRLQRRRRRYV
eukprot:Hpha_TRINITY_DN5481_c0_g1::TRINITY_DN5481_c0_g1_i1::g.192478::m.192478